MVPGFRVTLAWWLVVFFITMLGTYAVYVIEDVELSELKETEKGFTIIGDANFQSSGFSVSSAGDFNGDGFNDILVGAPGHAGDPGITYFIFGHSATPGVPGSFTDVVLSDSPLNGFKILAAGSDDNSGVAVSEAGDVNGDGISDIIIGSQFADADNSARMAAGVAYVIFGHTSNFSDVLLGNMDSTSTNGFRILGAAADDKCGASVSDAGDVNGDGIGDVIVSSYQFDKPGGIQDEGAVYIIFGKFLSPGEAFGDVDLLTFDVASAAGFRVVGSQVNDNLGIVVSNAGDVNGDGVDDIILGAWQAAPSPDRSTAGVCYVIYGNANPGFHFSNIDVGGMINNVTVGFRILGANREDQVGYTVGPAGDVNGDGVDDVIVGAAYAKPSQDRGTTGIAYVVFGRDILATSPILDLELATLTNGTAAGFRILCANADDFTAATGAGDVNGDGVDDIIIGSAFNEPHNNDTLSSAGTSYILFGRDTSATGSPFRDIDLKYMVTNASVGYRLYGQRKDDVSGSSVHALGDINGDGGMDFIIGAWGYDSDPANGINDGGASYVIYGTPPPTPTSQPSTQPSSQPSAQPVLAPTAKPSAQPSPLPSTYPSSQPSVQPSEQPFAQPSSQPSAQPSARPSSQPSTQPSMQPSSQPSTQPSVQPTCQPISRPSSQPSTQPSSLPSVQPSGQPSYQPSVQPSSQPSEQPVSWPSAQPSMQPSTQPSTRPSEQPSTQPSNQPSSQPSRLPSAQPSSQPSVRPSSQPTSQPSRAPSRQPSARPTAQPSRQPTTQPSRQPSRQPSSAPSRQPSSAPTRQPSGQPSSQPTRQPSSQPSSQPSVDIFKGEFESSLRNTILQSNVFTVSNEQWTCGAGNVSTSAACVLTDAISGAVVSQYKFSWDAVTSVIGVSNSTVLLSGRTVGATATSTTSHIATCSVAAAYVYCAVKSFVNTNFVGVSVVPLPNKILYVGQFNAFASATVVDRSTSVATSRYFSATGLQSVQLLLVQSPARYEGGFVAGSSVRSGTALSVIVSGLVRTATGVLTAMSLQPSGDDIVNNVDLVTGLVLEPTGPDSFIVGGLQVSDGAGLQAYLVRCNALYMTLQYAVRYRSAASGSRRRALSTASASTSSVMRGLVLVDTTLYMIADYTRVTAAGNITSLSMLKINGDSGAILQQARVSAPDRSLLCTDITAVGVYFTIACTVQRVGTASSVQSVLISVNRYLSFSQLPTGFTRYTNNTLVAETVPFKRTVLTVTSTSTTISTTNSVLNTADQPVPSRKPSAAPTTARSVQPSRAPSVQPSSSPSAAPSVSARPTSRPSTSGPTGTHKPSVVPTIAVTGAPTIAPTWRPTVLSTVAPTLRPTTPPSAFPSTNPTVEPTDAPTTACPTRRPSCDPTAVPTTEPSFRFAPSAVPSAEDAQSSAASAVSTRELPYVIGVSIGGALLIVACGYAMFRYYKHQQIIQARKKRFKGWQEVRGAETTTSMTIIPLPTTPICTPPTPQHKFTQHKFNAVVPMKDVELTQTTELTHVESTPVLTPPHSVVSFSDEDDDDDEDSWSYNISSLHTSERSERSAVHPRSRSNDMEEGTMQTNPQTKLQTNQPTNNASKPEVSELYSKQASDESEETESDEEASISNSSSSEGEDSSGEESESEESEVESELSDGSDETEPVASEKKEEEE